MNMKIRIVPALAALLFFAVIAQGQGSKKIIETTMIKNTCTYKIVDNHPVKADVYRYPGDEVRPAIFWIHGGALIFGTRNWLDKEQLDVYLAAGYTVISIDYRLAPETKLPGIIEDIEDAWEWVRTKGPELFKIDPDRIAVIGHSAGGYLTLMSGFCLNPRPQALVPFYGYGDITGPWYAQPDSFYNRMPAITKETAFQAVGDSVVSGTETEDSFEGRLQFYFYCRQQGIWPIQVCGHDPVKEYDWYKEYEPARNVSADFPPTLFLHGEKDTDVPFEQSVKMVAVLEKYGVEHELISRPDWDHGFDDAGLDDPAVREAFDRVLSFLSRHIGNVGRIPEK